MGGLKVKICGLQDADNIKNISLLGPDYMGFIFYPESKRYVSESFNPNRLEDIDAEIKKVGVFVNADPKSLIETVKLYNFDAVQLHGSETADYCKHLNDNLPAVECFKAFGLSKDFDFSLLHEFEPSCSLFVFDTKCESLGGSGSSFDWSILKGYRGSLPFLLSGGIGLENLSQAMDLLSTIETAVGVDINSRIETAPGFKSVDLAKQIIKEIRK